MKSPDHPLPVATLQEMGPAPTNPKPTQAPPIQVQFNPASLRLSMQNNVDMKKAFGKRPATQYDGTSSSTLTFDLVFDTADEGTTDEPVDVRKRVAPIEKFLLPASGQKKSIPPRVQFTYGTFQLIGVMTGLNADYDLFSANGVPLRAKLNVTIKEQLPEYEAGAVGSGANTGAAAQDTQGLIPGGGAAAPPDQTGTALGGETAPDFAARMGLDPSAWKELDLGGADALSLSAGLAIDFSASFGLELGLSAGFTIDASADMPLFAGDATPDPSAVTAAGGLQAAVDADASRAAATAANAARSAFAAPSAPGSPTGPVPIRTTSTATGTVAAASAPPTRDRRALTFGYGVPLRAVRGAPDPYGRLDTVGTGDVPTTDDPTVPGWLALPAPPPTAAAGATCQCGGTCRCDGTCGGAARAGHHVTMPAVPVQPAGKAALPIVSAGQSGARPGQVGPAPAWGRRHRGCGGCPGCGGGLR